MPISVDEEVVRKLEAKDVQLFALADTLDVKASIALVIITFLATQTANFLTAPSFPVDLRSVQMLSAGVLLVAGVLAVVTLWPRDYDVEDAAQLERWVQELRAHYKDAPNSENEIERAFRAGQAERLLERIAANSKATNDKSSLLNATFYTTMISVFLNIGTVFVVALP